MEDVYSFLASNEFFNPDAEHMSKSKLEEGLRDLTFDEILENLYEINNFLEDLAYVFRKERDNVKRD